MNDTFDYISRFVVILFGYCCAVLAAGWFLAAILYSQIDVLAYALADPFLGDVLEDMRAAWDMTGFYAAVLVAGPVLAIMAGSLSFLPAAALILLAEVRGYGSSLFYCVAGALIGLAAAGTTIPFQETNGGPEMPLLIAAMAGAGIVGGFVYWMIAGRNAGLFLNRPAS
ncbi:MAG: hypothetical protein J0H18_04530 [Rhizobiales bacterium]|nr:hypothetical protein [Hyphomicrobiales bacterium]OJY06799.1 MAG: hypothetical protein BGP07_17415 [Rhizobiales bacterium 63-22]